MEIIDFDLSIHLVDKLRYGANCTLARAHGRVTTPWNRTGYSALLCLALHPRKRTLRSVQLRIPG